jgi:hypothetical protein
LGLGSSSSEFGWAKDRSLFVGNDRRPGSSNGEEWKFRPLVDPKDEICFSVEINERSSFLNIGEGVTAEDEAL